MSKHRDARLHGDELRPTPRPPCAGGVSGKETRDKDRRLKEKSEHGMHPVIPPRFLIARNRATSSFEVLRTCSAARV
jgi:hypothetical protein